MGNLDDRRKSRMERVQQLRAWVEKQLPKWRNGEKTDPYPEPSQDFKKYNKKAHTIVGIVDNKIQILRDPNLAE